MVLIDLCFLMRFTIIVTVVSLWLHNTVKPRKFQLQWFEILAFLEINLGLNRFRE